MSPNLNPTMTAEARIKLAEVRQAVQQLRLLHHTLRHPHIDGCVECISLAWLKDNGF